jgi:hypothetical protein
MNQLKRLMARLTRAVTDAMETDAVAGGAVRTGVGRNPIVDQQVADVQQRKGKADKS